MKNSLIKHIPDILTGLGIAGVAITSLLSVKAGKNLEATKHPKRTQGIFYTQPKKPSKWEVAKTIAPPILSGAATVACIFFANNTKHKQLMAMASAAAMIEEGYRRYRNKNIELFGKENDDKIHAEIAKDRFIQHPTIFGGDDLEYADGELCIFYDEYTGRFFKTTKAQLIDAEYGINRNLSLRGDADINEFYDFIGIEGEPGGSDVGWDTTYLIEQQDSYWLDFIHRKEETKDGEVFWRVVYSVEPRLFENYS